jgi:hypothetical protein
MKHKKVALIIIYNHRYDKNIAILEDIYRERFSHIFHLVPFYTGVKENVIPVYENSYYFQGYIAQGFKSFYDEDFEHYFFIGDDLILNPVINENNYREKLKLSSDTSYIHNIMRLHQAKYQWLRTQEAFFWKKEQRGIEIRDEIPSYEEALKKFLAMDIEIKPLSFRQVFNNIHSLRNLIDIPKLDLRSLSGYLTNKFPLPYPMVGGYSDIFVVDAKAIKKFTELSGAFAATRLFVELAIPTALVLSAENIVTQEELTLKGRALWTPSDFEVLEKYENSLHKLLSDFPKNYLFLHPIKLSKWDTKISENQLS